MAPSRAGALGQGPAWWVACATWVALALGAAGCGSASIGGGSNVATVAAGSTFSLYIAYSISDCGCTGCRDQIEIGLVPGDGPLYCPYNSVPGCATHSGTNTHTITAPTASGTYDLRFNQRQDYACGDTWWDSTPPATQTFGRICVP